MAAYIYFAVALWGFLLAIPAAHTAQLGKQLAGIAPDGVVSYEENDEDHVNEPSAHQHGRQPTARREVKLFTADARGETSAISLEKEESTEELSMQQARDSVVRQTLRALAASKERMAKGGAQIFTVDSAGEASAKSFEDEEPFDCAAGFKYGAWKEEWSPEKKMWCCKQEKIGCEVLFDCDAGYARWKKGWSEMKKEYCCKKTGRACPEIIEPNPETTPDPTPETIEPNPETTPDPIIEPNPETTPDPTPEIVEPNPETTPDPTTEIDEPNPETTPDPTTEIDEPNSETTPDPTPEIDEPNPETTPDPTPEIDEPNPETTPDPTPEITEPNPETTPDPTPKMCCQAMTASCLSCSKGITEEEYCEQKPDTAGCKPQNRTSPNPSTPSPTLEPTLSPTPTPTPMPTLAPTTPPTPTYSPYHRRRTYSSYHRRRTYSSYHRRRTVPYATVPYATPAPTPTYSSYHRRRTYSYHRRRGGCQDTPGWRNGGNQGCPVYDQYYCYGGAARPGKEWTLGRHLNYPERHCCSCGGGSWR